METILAWQNVIDNKIRAAVAVGSVCFAVLLIYMQLGFYDTTRRSSTLVYDQWDFDLLLVSRHYAHLRAPGFLPRRRLWQAKRVSGVADTAALYVFAGDYRNPIDRSLQEAMIVGVEPDKRLFRSPAIQAKVAQLKKTDTAIMDRVTTTPGFGPITPNRMVEFHRKRLQVADVYDGGAGFIADGVLLVGDETMPRLFAGFSRERVSIALVQLEPTADRGQVALALRSVLPDDVQIWTRERVEANEQHFFLGVKPSGILFGAGVVLGFSVGAVVLYQILSGEVTRQLKEYATLKAMGYYAGALNSVVLQQAGMFAVLGYLPATGLAFVFYGIMEKQTKMPFVMTAARIVGVLVLSLALCMFAGWLASRKAHQKDPADLF